MTNRSPRLISTMMAGLLLVCASALSAQVDSATAAESPAPRQSLTGRVVLGTEGMPGLDVELHRVTPATSGVVDRTTSDEGGEFHFRLPPVDTTGFTVFFATAQHLGIRYFGSPLHEGDAGAGYTVEVFDTTSSPGEPVRITRRDMVMMAQPDGSWEINEIVRVSNLNERTVVSASGMPTAEVDLPAGAEAFEAGDGEAPSDQLQRMGDRVLLLMPLLPGNRELFFRYLLPARPSHMELGARIPADSLNLFVRQPSPTVTVQGLVPADLVTVEGERFLQYSATDPEAALRVEWRGTGSPINPVTAAIALLVVLFGIGGWAAVRNRSA